LKDASGVEVGEKARKRIDVSTPALAELYETFLGKPCGEKSHHLLHTGYTERPRV